MKETDTYQIFDAREDEYTLVLATNANIRNVCTVCTQAVFKSDDERLYYAQQGDVRPARLDKNGQPVYSFDNIYMQGEFWAALAQALFYDVPEIVKVKKGKPVIKRKNDYEKLNRAEVRRAFEDFLGKFAATPYEVSSLSGWLDSGQIRAIMSRVRALQETTGPAEPTGTPSFDGKTASSQATDSGSP